jgi:hypothetical protein
MYMALNSLKKDQTLPAFHADVYPSFQKNEEFGPAASKIDGCGVQQGVQYVWL